MRRISRALMILALAVSVAHAEETKMMEHPARTSGRDIKIPRKLVKEIEEDYHVFLKKNEVSAKENVKRQMLNMSVELTQRHPVALHEDVRVVTPLGGGVIDLAEFLTPLRGEFNMKIVAKKEDGSEPAVLRVFFVSHAKRRILEGEEYGAGCHKYMEITNFYNKKSSGKGQGFELYTAGQRYLSVVGGTFVVVAYDKEALSVGTLSFLDSRFPELLCE